MPYWALAGGLAAALATATAALADGSSHQTAPVKASFAKGEPGSSPPAKPAAGPVDGRRVERLSAAVPAERLEPAAVVEHEGAGDPGADERSGVSGAGVELETAGSPEGPRASAPAEAPPKAQPAPLGAVMSDLDTTGTPSVPPRIAPPATQALPGRRPRQDYRGRAKGPSPLSRTLTWVPRTLLMPAHLAAEYLLRRPVVGGLALAEEHFVLERIERLFTFNEGKAGFFPTFELDRGLKARFGFSAFANELFAPDNILRFGASANSDRLLTISAEDRLRVFRNGSGQLIFSGGLVRRPDGNFYGLSNATSESDRTFFFFEELRAGLGLLGALSGLNRVGLNLGFKKMRFEGSDWSRNTPDILTVFPAPAGFEGFSLLETRFTFAVDSRQPRDVDYQGTGLRLEGLAGFSIDPTETNRNFAIWGGELAGFVDFSGFNHVLGLRIMGRFVEDTGRQPVPFTELVELGGSEYMRGFIQGRLRGDSAFVATAQYRYPIHAFVDSELFSSVGNVFPGHWDGLDLESLYWNYGLALRSNFSRETSVGLTVAFASTRFDNAAFEAVDFVRIVVGVNNGF